MMIIDSIPGDKSMSHRAIIIGSLVKGSTIFDGFLLSDDCLSTLEIFRQLGITIEIEGTCITICGKGPRGLTKPKGVLDVGNSGTGIRLISGVLAGVPFESKITGDDSIQNRPMGRIIEPLTQMGASISSSHQRPPLSITGQVHLKKGWSYKMPVASAQVKSAILLAAVTAGVKVTVTEPEPCRDHTERMLRLFGAKVHSKEGVIHLMGPKLTVPKSRVQIPSDVSSALFFICLSLMINQPITFKNIGLNPSRTGCLEVLQMMGASIRILNQTDAYEPMGDIEVTPSSELSNISIPLNLIPNIIDELPIFAVLATSATGTFKVRGAQELRVKESDRIDGICRLMGALGAKVTEYDDGFDIHGPIQEKSNLSFDAKFDHRLAMSALIASKAYGIEAKVQGLESISTSFPNFLSLLKKFNNN